VSCFAKMMNSCFVCAIVFMVSAANGALPETFKIPVAYAATDAKWQLDWSHMVGWLFPTKFSVAMTPDESILQLKQRISARLGNVPIARLALSDENQNWLKNEDSDPASYLANLEQLNVHIIKYLLLKLDCDCEYPSTTQQAAELGNKIRKTMKESMKNSASGDLRALADQLRFQVIKSDRNQVRLLLDVHAAVTQSQIDAFASFLQRPPTSTLAEYRLTEPFKWDEFGVGLSHHDAHTLEYYFQE